MSNHRNTRKARGNMRTEAASHADIINAFRAAMADAGMIVNVSITADGTLHRCHVDGDKPGSKNGAYILHLDGRPSGYFEHFKTGLRQAWTLSGKREPMTAAMRQQIETARQQRQQEQQQAHRVAAEKARFVWSRGGPVTDQAEHHYLMKKQVQPHGLRMGRDGVLMIPLFSPQGEVVNLQFIDADGNKRFLSGGQKKGCFAVIGNPTSLRASLKIQRLRAVIWREAKPLK